ncbi:MAG: elongation factor P [Armatimonadetes bacterium]|nr:elongation factor P [Armatimonadota bacterium]
MISVNDFHTGVSIELEGELWQVVEFQHVKPGKGSPFVRAKLRNIRKDFTVEKTFRGGEKVKRAIIERRPAQYLYMQDEFFTFMDAGSYEQYMVTEELLGDGKKWLKDGMEVMLVYHGDQVIGVEMPNFVELEVTVTDPGFKGDTATGGTKPATVETGAVVQVPLFIEVGDRLQIDTRTGAYLKRV